MEVLKLREKQSGEDFMFKGDMIRVRVEPSHRGFAVKFVKELSIDLPGELPPFILQILDMEKVNGKTFGIVMKRVVKPRWFDRLLFISMESRIKKEVALVKKQFQLVQDKDNMAEKIQNSL